MNVASAKGVNLLSRYGFSRVHLARELSLKEITDIRGNTNMELEVFVHGALCISVSGVCLFSAYLGGKSANRGICTQACRRYYTAHKGKSIENSSGESGGYYFSPADLELLREIPSLATAGINSFKIEGLARSAEYVGVAVSAYRLVMDNLEAGEESLKRAMADAGNILKNDFARPKTAYLINKTSEDENNASDIDWLNPKQGAGTGIPLGPLLRVRGRPENRRGLIQAGLITPSLGDSIRLHKADNSERVLHKITFVETGPDGESWISIPEGQGSGFIPGDEVYLIQTKAMTRRYPQLITREGTSRGPGREKAPLPGSVKDRRKAKPDLPEGYYTMVSSIEDLYVLQSVRPARVILGASGKCVKQLLESVGLPFQPRDIILSLDPFFPQDKDRELEDSIPALIDKGYNCFIVNNLGHFSLFHKTKEKRALLIAGPALYTFNAWAGDFIAQCGTEYCVSPLENNRQNLEKTFSREGQFIRSKVFVTIFSSPSLFRIRQDLHNVYDFKNFTDGKKEAFRLTFAPEGTNVYPWGSFSIVDKTPFLKEAGFTRFILDFSPGPLKKADYRDIMEAVKLAAPIPGTNRFNWKNGFFKDTK